MPSGFLRVSGDKVVDEHGTAAVLRGAGLGGWMKYAPFSHAQKSRTNEAG